MYRKREKKPRGAGVQLLIVIRCYNNSNFNYAL